MACKIPSIIPLALSLKPTIKPLNLFVIGSAILKNFSFTEFSSQINSIEDLKENMVLDGTVRNVIDFGAFVDIGVHQDGLVHISQLANRRLNSPSEVVKLHQHILVRVMDVDLKRQRIQFSMKDV